MRTFTLLLEDGENSRKIEFDGYDSSSALGLLEREETARVATLWERETRLATIVRLEGGFWQISNVERDTSAPARGNEHPQRISPASSGLANPAA